MEEKTRFRNVNRLVGAAPQRVQCSWVLSQSPLHPLPPPVLSPGLLCRESRSQSRALPCGPVAADVHVGRLEISTTWLVFSDDLESTLSVASEVIGVSEQEHLQIQNL